LVRDGGAKRANPLDQPLKAVPPGAKLESSLSAEDEPEGQGAKRAVVCTSEGIDATLSGWPAGLSARKTKGPAFEIASPWLNPLLCAQQENKAASQVRQTPTRPKRSKRFKPVHFARAKISLKCFLVNATCEPSRKMEHGRIFYFRFSHLQDLG